jgi:mannosyltransferase
MKKEQLLPHSMIAVIVVLAFALRLPHLNGSFWLDEAAQALESSRPLSQQLNIAADFQPPLIHLLVFLALKISTAEWWLRLVVSVIPGLITIWVTYLIGKHISSKQVGLVASALLATSSFHVFYSQELRPYSLPTMWALLSWWFLLNTVSKKGGGRHWLFFTLSTIAGLYSSYLYPFLVLSQLAYIAWVQRKLLIKILGSLAASTLAFLPWLPSFLGQLEEGGHVRTTIPGWEAVVSTPQIKSLALIAAKFVFGVMNVELTFPFIVICGGIVAGIAYLLSIVRTKGNKLPKRAVSLILMWLIIPFASSWLVSFVVPVVQPKRLLYLLPALYLLVSLLVFGHAKQLSKNSKAIGLLLITALFVVNLFSTALYYTKPSLQRENWRDLHAEIIKNYGDKKAIAVFAFTDPFAPWHWYDDGTFPTWSTGKLNTQDVNNLSDQIKTVSEYDYVLLFDYLRDLTDANDDLRDELWSLGYTEVDTIDYPQIGFVRVYSKQKKVAAHN